MEKVSGPVDDRSRIAPKPNDNGVFTTASGSQYERNELDKGNLKTIQQTLRGDERVRFKNWARYTENSRAPVNAQKIYG